MGAWLALAGVAAQALGVVLPVIMGYTQQPEAGMALGIGYLLAGLCVVIRQPRKLPAAGAVGSA